MSETKTVIFHKFNVTLISYLPNLPDKILGFTRVLAVEIILLKVPKVISQ